MPLSRFGIQLASGRKPSFKFSVLCFSAVLVPLAALMAALMFLPGALFAQQPGGSYEEQWCVETGKCLPRISSAEDFDRLIPQDTGVSEFYSGPSIQAIVPVPSRIGEFCAGHERCLQVPIFFSDYTGPMLIRDHYPESFAEFNDWEYSIKFSDWQWNAPIGDSVVYRTVSIFRIRQSPDKYGLRIGYATNATHRVSPWDEIVLPTLEEVRDLMSVLTPLINGPLYYYPTGILPDYQKQAREWEAAGSFPFPVFYETLTADAITNEQQYQLIGSCLSVNDEQCRILFFAPRPSLIREYCQPFIDAGKPCLDHIKFANSVFWGFHRQVFLLLAPGQVDSVFSWTAAYQLGSIWREPFEDFYRFNLEKATADQVYSCEDIQESYDEISANFSIGELAYVPYSGWGDQKLQEDVARQCLQPRTEHWCPPPPYDESECRDIQHPAANYRIIFSDQAPPYEAYTTGVAYGTMKVLTLAEFDEQVANRQLNWQDIVAVDQTPFDVETPLTGIITGTRQLSAASHVALRFARRNRPDAYRLGATAELAQWNGQSVKLEVTDRDYFVSAAMAEEVIAWQQANRPRLKPPQPVNRTYRGLDRVREVTEEPTSSFSRFGGKTSGLVKLYRILEPKYQLEAFGIPFSYFYDFMHVSRLRTDSQHTDAFPAACRFGGVTYEEFYQRLLASTEVMASPQLRGDCLSAFYEEGKDHGTIPKVPVPGSAIPQNLNQVLANRISALWNDADKNGLDDTTGANIQVRFRSSSNMEDSIEFNGAGLYESRTVCLRDYYDADTAATCDPNEDHEETVEHALRDVWMSLFLPRAFEEREYWQLPQDKVAMAILANTGTPDEISNGVILSGDPAVPYWEGSTMRSHYITAQPGEISVVSPAEGERPEINQVETTVQATYWIIRREQSSSEVPAGQYVLQDDQLKEISKQVSAVERAFPFDTSVYPKGRILLDMEFKYLPNRQLIIKQLRPFLIGESQRYDGTPSLPAVPQNLTAQIQGTQVVLRWQTTETDALAIVERSYSGVTWAPLDTVNGSFTTYTDTTVAVGSTYLYRVRLENAFGQSGPSNQVTVTVPLSAQFIRGDANRDGKADISDAVSILGFLFLGDPAAFTCDDAADVNDSGGVNITDAIHLLSFLFIPDAAHGTDKIPAPHPGLGVDPTVDDLGCR